MRSLFADNRCLGQDARQRLAQQVFGMGIGNGDQVIDRFVGHIARGQMLIARQDRGLRDARQQRAQFGIESAGRHVSGIITWLAKPGRSVRPAYQSSILGSEGRSNGNVKNV